MRALDANAPPPTCIHCRVKAEDGSKWFKFHCRTCDRDRRCEPKNREHVEKRKLQCSECHFETRLPCAKCGEKKIDPEKARRFKTKTCFDCHVEARRR